MEYIVYKQNPPISIGYAFRAVIVEVARVNVPSGKCPIDYARERFDIDCPLVSAVNGYTEEGKVRQQLQ
jgi:hypothetical protein